MFQEIYIIDDDINSTKILEELFKDDKEYIFKNVKSSEIEIALRNIPSLIIINEDNIKENIIELCSKIRENEDNSITPVIVASANTNRDHRIDVLQTHIEYYIKKPLDKEYLYHTIKNIVRLMHTNRGVSPLTGLPGNVQIQAELKKRLLNEESFAILYIDLDNFKAYNDVYGFLKGDEIIKFTARTVLKHVHELKNGESFVGHIGGDDFVAMVPTALSEEICQNIIIDFDENVLQYFNAEDIARAYLEVENRKGILEQFPITSISIAGVVVDKERFDNVLEIGEVGAQVKHIAKATLGSTYIINRRK